MKEQPFSATWLPLPNLLGVVVIYHDIHLLSLLVPGLHFTPAVVIAALLKATGRPHINR